MFRYLLVALMTIQVPEKLTPPAGEELLLQAKGKGSQIYICKDSGGKPGWILKAPDAKLFGDNGELLGRHFAGPTWEATDGSRITGKVVANVPSPDNSIPWLLLTVTSHSGKGLMDSVNSVQRLDTKDGKAPADGCDAKSLNQEMPVAYQAEYKFYGRKK